MQLGVNAYIGDVNCAWVVGNIRERPLCLAARTIDSLKFGKVLRPRNRSYCRFAFSKYGLAGRRFGEHSTRFFPAE